MALSEDRFYSFLREERQFCAVLSHLLLQRGNNVGNFVDLLSNRLTAVSDPWTDRLGEAEIYVDFAYLRDKWDNLGAKAGRTRTEANESKREFIRGAFDRLGISHAPSINLAAPVDEFNGQFISRQNIRSDIASPHHWEVKRLHELAGGSEETFSLLCKFKWSFNIKPDLVIVIPGCRPICIEAKLESREAFYPTSAHDVRHFKDPKTRVRQLAVQQFMFRELLQNPAQHVVIARDIPHGNQEQWLRDNRIPVLKWLDVFALMDFSGSLPFVRKLFDENSTLRKSGQNPGTA